MNKLLRFVSLSLLAALLGACNMPLCGLPGFSACENPEKAQEGVVWNPQPVATIMPHGGGYVTYSQDFWDDPSTPENESVASMVIQFREEPGAPSQLFEVTLPNWIPEKGESNQMRKEHFEAGLVESFPGHNVDELYTDESFVLLRGCYRSQLQNSNPPCEPERSECVWTDDAHRSFTCP